jgi:phosphoglucomutase
MEEATYQAASGRRKKRPKREKNEKLAERALQALADFRGQSLSPLSEAG